VDREQLNNIDLTDDSRMERAEEAKAWDSHGELTSEVTFSLLRPYDFSLLRPYDFSL
jgi:hypothetical protein